MRLGAPLGVGHSLHASWAPGSSSSLPLERLPALLDDKLPIFITSSNTKVLKNHMASVHALTRGSGKETDQHRKGYDGGK